MNTPLRRIRPAFFALGLLVNAVAAMAAVTFRALPFEEACAAASREGKIVLIDFYTTWCEPCKRLDAQTWSDPGVGELVDPKAIALKLDAEKEGRELARRFKISAYPTVLLLKPDGTELDRLMGFLEPAAFSQNFRLALEGKNSRSRAVDAVAAKGATIDHDAVQARYDLGRTLAREGDHAGALREYLWCFDVGMIAVESYTGVRTSFLLGEIGRLAKVFPPAREAMLERCAVAEARLGESIDERKAGQEFAAFCSELGDEARMMAVFDRFAKDDPRRATFGFRAFRVLLPKQRYDDALSVMPFATMERLFQSTANRPPPGNDPRIAESIRRSGIGSALDFIEVLAGASDLTHAQTMMGELLSYDGTEQTRKQLGERLARAGQPQLFKTP